MAAMAAVVVYAVAVLTPWGQAVENALLPASDETQTLAYIPYAYLRLPPLYAEIPTIVVGLAILVAIAAMRRKWRELVTVLVAVPVSVVLQHALAALLGRPGFDPAVPLYDRAASFPSGHVVIAATVSIGLLIVVPRAWIRWCAPIVLGWAALVTSAVMAMGWHRPSDVIGAALLVCAVFLAVTAVIAQTAAPIRRGEVRPWATILVVLISAVLFAIKPTAWMIPIIAFTTLIAVTLVAATALRLCRSE